jgi:phospholipid transport system substrate-binding protein
MRAALFACRLAVVTGLVIACGPPSHAAVADPAALVAAFDDQARHMLADASLSPTDRQERFHALVDQNFDFPVIARYVLGRYWQSTPDAVRREFEGVFEDYVIERNAAQLNSYSGPLAAVTAQRADGDRVTIVATSFAHEDGDPPTLVEWRVLSTTDGLKITDISVSGVSIALSYREQFAAAIQRNGGQVSALIPELRSKLSARPAEEKRSMR